MIQVRQVGCRGLRTDSGSGGQARRPGATPTDRFDLRSTVMCLLTSSVACTWSACPFQRFPLSTIPMSPRAARPARGRWPVGHRVPQDPRAGHIQRGRAGYPYHPSDVGIRSAAGARRATCHAVTRRRTWSHQSGPGRIRLAAAVPASVLPRGALIGPREHAPARPEPRGSPLCKRRRTGLGTRAGTPTMVKGTRSSLCFGH